MSRLLLLPQGSNLIIDAVSDQSLQAQPVQLSRVDGHVVEELADRVKLELFNFETL